MIFWIVSASQFVLDLMIFLALSGHDTRLVKIETTDCVHRMRGWR
jgi:hypothetical protein